MAVSSILGRPSRSSRVRGRNDSGEENVPLDLSRDPAENLREILQNVAKQQGVSNMRKLGHLNNFVKLLCSVGHSEEKLGFTYEEMIICLRLALLNEAKEVRAAGLRALRYLIRDSSVLEKVLGLQVDYLIARCIDIQQSNEIERTQALRLARKMITVNALLFPSSVTNSLIAVGNDGLHERDRMVRACIAIICELSLKNPVVVAQRGGLSTILKSVTDCQLSRINEALITTILHLLNHPHTRQYVRSDVELEQILAPYTDFHYRHSPDIAEGQLKEDREARFMATKMSIVASFRSWSGIINLCKSGNSGIQSLIGLLCIPNMEVRKGLLEVLYDIFQLVIPVATADFNEALISVDPSRFQDSWRLSDGFVASEAKTILPHRSCSRPDLMDNYLALVLSAFIKSGLLEGLVEVITSSDDALSIRATILVGELLHMANTILPHSHSHHLHCLPTLMNMAASFDIASEKRLRASASVNYLKCFHEKKKRGAKPYSLYLDHILRTSGGSHYCREQHFRPQRDIFIVKETEDALVTNMRDSHIFNHKENLDWNWCLIGTILKWPNVSLRSNRDEQMHKFVRRLLFFYKPSSKLYGSLELEHPKARQLTVVGCQFVEFLLASEEEGQAYLEDLVRDIVQCLFSSAGLKPDRSLQGSGLLTTLSQHYFLFLGALSAHPHGVKMLEKCSVFQWFLSIPKGFSYLSERGYITKQMEKWQKEYNLKYVDMIEEQLNEALTTYRKPVNGDNYVRRSNQRLQRPNVYLPVHLYGQLVHDKTGCQLLQAQNVVPDLSDSVRSPALDKWEGIKNLKAALWALGNIGSSNWGLNLLLEEGVIPDIVALAHHCEVLSIRGACLYVLGLISKTKQGCETLKQQGWDAVRHSRSMLWPIVPEELEPQPRPYSLLSSVPSTLRLIDSTGSRHNSESDSVQHSAYMLDDERLEGCDFSEESSLYVCPKLTKDRSPLTMLASSRFRNRLLHSLSLPGKKPRATPYIKSSNQGQGGGLDGKQVLKCTSYSFVATDVFPIYNGHLSKSSSGGRETSLVGNKAIENGGSIPSIGEGEMDGSGVRNQRSYERLAEDGPSGGGGAQFKSRSQSFNTDTTTSGISSMSSSPSRETLPSTIDADCVSLNTVISTQTIQNVHSLTPQPCSTPLSIPKSCSASLVPPGSSHTLPRRAQSLKSPSVSTLSSLADYSLYSSSRDALGYATLKYSSSHNGCTSPRDALGYATLRRLQHQRIQPSLSHSEALASPAKDILFTDAITMNTGSLDSRLTSRRFLKALSYASLDKEDLLSPINQTTLQRSSSVRSIVSTGTYGSSDDYIGLALPVNINNMFQIKETPYFQKRMSPPSEDRSAKFFSGDSDGPSDGCWPARLRSQLSITELMAVSRAEQQQMLGSEETGLQEHNDNNCLYCAGLSVLGLNSQNNEPDLTEVPPFSEWPSSPPANHLEVMVHVKLSGGSGCSDTVSQGSVGSGRSTELVLGMKSIPEDAPAGRVLLRKEVLRLVINLSSSVGTKNHETNLLTIKEKFPYAFDDVCLYSEVSYLLAHCMFRLASRRFIQELFQDVPFVPMYEEAESILSVLPQKSSSPQSDT
ncbi:rapamycin-insensitive companion of mTOR-like [Morone saxatilis]|uniref:rapamycin-insensitive companion of mTOR-like n=1 Tax=Morone saxatilis TaxID=34816 RepID=UPI0015E1ED06|nr:rapamycin-insensitive companion of mTOR-like [Morone saxatilis]